MADISIDTFNLNELKIFLDMTFNEYGVSDTTNSEHIKWKHLSSPFSASTYISLLDEKIISGRSLVQPRNLSTVSKTFSAGLVTDLLIDKKHRSSPINFINITKACSNIEKYDLIYHTSNDRTFSLYSKLFRFSNPFTLSAYAFPIKFSGLFSLIVGHRFSLLDLLVKPIHWFIRMLTYMMVLITKVELSQRSMSDEELKRLSTKCLVNSGPHLERTNEFLKWRFRSAPLWTATVYRLDRKGFFLGYVATRKVSLGGLTNFVLMDFLIDPEMPFFSRITLRLLLIRKAISSRADALFLMANSFNSITKKIIGFPFVRIPDKRLPHATPIFVRARNAELKNLEEFNSMHMTLADLDYF